MNTPCDPQLERARSYDDPVPFNLEQRKMDATSWSHAIFVVHGIGAHEAGVTAVGLRSGFEDAVEELRKSSGKSWQEMPPTYIKEGYWGDYGNFADNFPDLWKEMNRPSQKYFEELWTNRAESYTRTALWYAWQSFKLPWRALTQWGNVSGNWVREVLYRLLVRLPLYVLVIFVSWVALIALLVWPRGRKILSTVMGDVRLYVAPSGPVEQAMCQNIDIRVRDLFLQMLGLGVDPDTKEFKHLVKADLCDQDLAGRKLLRIGEKRDQKFDRITWVSHSLGTVVSYNVVADLFCKCDELRKAAGGVASEEVQRVEAGLYRFYTMGSPLRKITWLFPNVLRPWPKEYFEKHMLTEKGFPLKCKKTDTPCWWVNFRHIWDPVSGNISRSDLFTWAKDCHSTEIVTLPGVAHVGYWHTKSITKYILAQAHPGIPGGNSAKLPNWPQKVFVKILWQISMMFMLALVSAIFLRIVELLGAKGIEYLTPWWNWLVMVPLVGPVLQFFGWLVIKILCGISVGWAFLYSKAACLLAQLWSWIRHLVSA